MAHNSWLNPINNILGAASSYYHHGNHMPPSHQNGIYHHIPNQGHYSPSTPLNPQPYRSPPTPQPYHSPTTPSHKPTPTTRTHLKTLKSLKRHTKLLTTASLLISTLTSLFMEASMIYTLSKFFRTAHTPASDYTRSSPWAEHTVLWPSYMLLAASGVTMLLCLGSLLVRCCRWRKAEGGINLLTNAVHVGVWVGVTVLYRVFKKEKDLWGWSCGGKAEGIQGVFEGVVDFSGLCKLQVRRYFPLLIRVDVIQGTDHGGT